jgi:hypothetical protein
MGSKRFNLGVISVLVALLVVSIAFMSGCAGKPSSSPPPPPPTPPITSEPGVLSTQGYVYDDKLGYGFEYPGGWEFYVEEGDFPKGIKKVVSFEKEIPKDGVICRVLIGLTVKSATDLQEVKNELKKEIEISETPILNEATILVNNMSGYDILSGIPTWKQRQVVFFANGMAYIFKYASPEEYYRMYEETFDHIINSFVIE